MLTVDYKLMDIRPGEYVLDLGCGEGRHTFGAWQAGNGHVIALDLDEEAIARTSIGIRDRCRSTAEDRVNAALRGDALNLPFPDATFDRVICAEMLEHVPDDRACVREIVRVLKPGGRLAVSVPRFLPERICWALSDTYHNNPGGHIRIYRASDLRVLLESNGLRFEAMHYKHALHSLYWIMRCLFGADNESAFLPSLYHRLLVWDLMKSPRPVRMLEEALDPLFGKSVVLYFTRDGCAG